MTEARGDEVDYNWVFLLWCAVGDDVPDCEDFEEFGDVVAGPHLRLFGIGEGGEDGV